MNRTSPPKRTTIYDLAELAGTSASAVSAVLNGNWKKRRISAKLAEKITRLAEEQGYALNMQASVLRRERSRIIGMIVPKYDNRYFGSIVEQFEARARERGLFPIITCTMRDPALEMEAARTMLSYQVDCLIATGATDPDRIVDLYAAAGVPTINLDLPGSRAPSVISDNYGGALELTRRVLANCEREYGEKAPLLFIGGRGTDHNTMERVRGFRDAHRGVRANHKRRIAEQRNSPGHHRRRRIIEDRLNERRRLCGNRRRKLRWQCVCRRPDKIIARRQWHRARRERELMRLARCVGERTSK